MNVSNLISVLPLILLLCWAAAEDFRTRKIRNWLTLTLIVSGLARSYVGDGAMQVTPGQAWLGFAVGFIIPFALFALGAIGGGDVKLIAGVGAWLGPLGVVQVLIAEAIVGMIIVLIQCTASGKLLALFRNSALLAVNLVHLKEVGLEHVSSTGRACRSVDRPLPYAVPVLIATVIVVGRLV